MARIDMQPARLIVLAIAGTAGLGAAYLMSGSKQPETVRVMVPAPAVPKDAVLVAARDLSYGSVVASADLRWQPWPKDQIPAGVVSQTSQPNGAQEVEGSIVRSNFLAGEPIRQDRLVKGNGAGFMSAVLQPGFRAVAIDLADQGKSAAGGFVLPNDRVDVIRTYHPDDAPTATASETILSNIRVLAIGQNVQEKSQERAVIGATATLEVTAEQAERLVLAQRTGQLTLSLRSMRAMANAGQSDDVVPGDDKTMTIIRFGNATQARLR